MDLGPEDVGLLVLVREAGRLASIMGAPGPDECAADVEIELGGRTAPGPVLHLLMYD